MTPCGLYRTTESIGDSIPSGALVYYHNHGDPGPGLYLPKDWHNNRAVFHEHGTTVPDESYADTLEALLPEGLYRVEAPFYCCEQRCQYFEDDMMLQLGYNGDAQPILFIPEMIDGAIALPAEGTLVSEPQLSKLRPLKVAVVDGPSDDATPLQ